MLAAAREVIALAPGVAKAAAVARIFAETTSIADAPAKGALLSHATWLLDSASATTLSV
jgi:6-phosphogluconolactonase/glucosamine-6-phosphate isomerase/deaminase